LPFTQTALLGALAGFTIFLSLPVGRLDNLSSRARVALAMFSVGVLAFLFVDVLSHGAGIVEGAVNDLKAGGNDWGRAIGLTLLLAGGFTAGTAGLGLLERIMRPRSQARPPIAGGATEAMTAGQVEVASLHDAAEAARRHALAIGMTVAAAIGLHNFAEGLAIGVSSRAGDLSLATVLIVGFALHNATEGFGIIGPLGDVRPSWRWLALAGLIGGGPTFVGAMVGYSVTSQPLELAFYALAGGAILYVIGEIWHGMRRYGHRELGLLMVAAGFTAGVITDLVVVYGGG